MSLVRALRLVSAYVNLPESAKSELEQILAELETPVTPPEEAAAPTPAVVDVAASSDAVLAAVPDVAVEAGSVAASAPAELSVTGPFTDPVVTSTSSMEPPPA